MIFDWPVQSGEPAVLSGGWGDPFGDTPPVVIHINQNPSGIKCFGFRSIRAEKPKLSVPDCGLLWRFWQCHASRFPERVEFKRSVCRREIIGKTIDLDALHKRKALRLRKADADRRGVAPLRLEQVSPSDRFRVLFLLQHILSVRNP